MSQSIVGALNCVEQRIRDAERASGRPDGSVRLVAVSKTVSSLSIREAWEAGQRVFGESYVKEWIDKEQQLLGIDVEWHFIGPLQSNKTRPIAERAHWVHSVDRWKIAERLSFQRPSLLPPLNICIQVNVSGEESKNGCTLDEVAALAYQIVMLPRLQLRGLMCVPEHTTDTAKLTYQFALLRQLVAELNKQGLNLDTLSMGMSSDMELAIREGATIVRIGSDIFGRRN